MGLFEKSPKPQKLSKKGSDTDALSRQIRKTTAEHRRFLVDGISVGDDVLRLENKENKRVPRVL